MAQRLRIADKMLKEPDKEYKNEISPPLLKPLIKAMNELIFDLKYGEKK